MSEKTNMPHSASEADWQALWGYFPRQHGNLCDLQHRLRYTFSDITLLQQSLTHRSAITEYHVYCEHKGIPKISFEWNERIEFLGDAILGAIAGSFLWNSGKCKTEGSLSRFRARLVCESTLARIAKKLELDACVLIGKSERRQNPQVRDALLADSLEALVGALYLDSSFDATKAIVEKWLEEALDELSSESMVDDKTRLQEFMQKQGHTPTYTVLHASGPAHDRRFQVGVTVGGKLLAQASGRTIKVASQEAARLAWTHESGK